MELLNTALCGQPHGSWSHPLAGCRHHHDRRRNGPARIFRRRRTGDPRHSSTSLSTSAVDARGNAFFADTFNHRIRKIDRQAGTITTVAGTGKKGFSGDGGLAREAMLDEPYGVAVDDAGNLYFADRLNRRVRRVDARTGHDRHDRGNRPGSVFRRRRPRPRWPAWSSPTAWPSTAMAGTFTSPTSPATGSARSTCIDGQISTFSGTGKPQHDGDMDPRPGPRSGARRAVALGSDGTVYILEREGNRLRAVDPRTGLITTIAGTGIKGYSGDGGPAVKATFNGPKELAVDRRGNVWIVDTENHAIRLIEAGTGLIRTVAGTGRVGRRRRRRTRHSRPARPAARSGRRHRRLDLDRRHEQPPDPPGPHGSVNRPDSQTDRVVDRIRTSDFLLAPSPRVDFLMKNTQRTIPPSEAGPGDGVPPFEPHPWLRAGHAQTVVGRYLANGDLHLRRWAM